MMGKIAFIFPGQGSQYLGMGKEIHDSFSCARDVFLEADLSAGMPISRLCFEGPSDSLKLTENTQPAILAVSVAVTRVLEERGYWPDYVAGHSLGEYSALVCAGSLTLSNAIQTVRKLGRYTQEAVPVGKGGMAAVLGLEASLVEKACYEASGLGVVAPANYNAPDQIVIAGESVAVRRAGELAKGKGAKRIVDLPVSAPFNCSLMEPARQRLSEDLNRTEFRDLSVPLFANADASQIRRGPDGRDALIRQVCQPVMWLNVTRNLLEEGVTQFVEVGPGKVLSGFVKKIAPQVETLSVDSIRGIEALASALPSAKM